MNGFLLDTNVLSEFSRLGKPDAKVQGWFESTEEIFLFAGAITIAEIRRGIELLPDGKMRMDLQDWFGELKILLKVAFYPLRAALESTGPFFQRKLNAAEIPWHCLTD